MQLFGENKIPEEHILYRSKHSFVFVNLRPFLQYHVLVSPLRIVTRVFDLNEQESNDLFECVKKTTIALKDFSEGYTLNIQDGISAGQKVPHIHVHIVSRNLSDLKNNDDIYKEGALDCSRPDRSFKEMKDEADFLRPFFEKFNK